MIQITQCDGTSFQVSPDSPLNSQPVQTDQTQDGSWWAGTHHPKLISEPTIHALPLTLPSSAGVRTSRPRALAIASTLLNLPTPGSSPSYSGGPHLHVAPSGQVSVVLDPSTSKGKKRQVQGNNSRNDWIVILEFEAPVEQGGDRYFRKVPLSPSLDDKWLERANTRSCYQCRNVYIQSFDFKLPHLHLDQVGKGKLVSLQNLKCSLYQFLHSHLHLYLFRVRVKKRNGSMRMRMMRRKMGVG